MVAVTATILDEEVPRARLAVLVKHFSWLGDDRESWRVMYPLKEGVLLKNVFGVGIGLQMITAELIGRSVYRGCPRPV